MAATQFPPPTINVVPGGYRWSRAAAEAAAARGSFIRVGGTQVGRRTLSGARKSWTRDEPEENTSIFLLEHRITGTPDAVALALQYAGFSQAEITAALANAITRENFQTTKAREFAAEVDAYNAGRKNKTPAARFEWSDIIWFAQNIKSAQIGTKAGEPRGAVAVGGRAGAGESIADKVRKLGAGKVLDVSNMDVNTGKGVRAVPAPKTAKSGKFGTRGIPIISNNIDKYVRALELAYGANAATEYAGDIQQVRKALTGQPTQAARPPSPRAAVGATIAPAAQFVPRVTTPGRGAGGVATLGGGAFPNMQPLRQ